MLPNFLIVGGPRCGTTYLHQCLAEHPDIFMAGLSYSGDINFFNPGSEISAIQYYDRGLAWYEQLFEGRRNEHAVGEKSAHYFADPEVPARLFAHVPDARLIVVIRDPIARAYSDFWYSRGKLPAGAGFVDACLSRTRYGRWLIPSGLYYESLQRYLKFFPTDRIHVVVNDFLQTRPRRELATLFGFLGVDSTFIPSCVDRKINGAVGPGNSIYRLRAVGHHLKMNHPAVFRALKRFPTTGLERAIGRRMTKRSADAAYPPMAAADRRRLVPYFAADTRQMGSYLSVDLDAMWHMSGTDDDTRDEP